MRKFKTIDLFAGAGGLSLGFIQTGRFDVKVAFENNPAMQQTYKNNHPDTVVYSDVCDADYKGILKQFGDIDVVIGGPPCQGFSNANRQKSHAINMNNMLVKQYIRAIVELQPKAFVMENVSMLRSDTHRFFMDRKDKSVLGINKIKTKDSKLVLIDKKYSFLTAKSIIENREQIVANIFPENAYKELNILYKATNNSKKFIVVANKHKAVLLDILSCKTIPQADKYIKKVNDKCFKYLLGLFEVDLSIDNNSNIDLSEVRDTLEPVIMIQRMLSKAMEIIDNEIVVDHYETKNGITAVIKSYSVYDYLVAILTNDSNGYSITSGILCAADFGAPQKRERFILMGIKRSICQDIQLPSGSYTTENYNTVEDAIRDIQSETPFFKASDDVGIMLKTKGNLSPLARTLRNSDLLFNHIVTETTDEALKRFKLIKQGQNFHSLPREHQTNTYTDPTRTQNTIYLRLDYKRPSGTVVNVRKSMWIHPVLDRAVSVREAARLQTFPDSFRFYGSKDKQYQQVGNAVPPILAKGIAEQLVRLLS